MHDTYLLNKISETLKKLSRENKIKMVNRFTLVVNPKSHINQENLREHLFKHNINEVSDALEIEIQKEDIIEEQMAILHSLVGETIEL